MPLHTGGRSAGAPVKLNSACRSLPPFRIRTTLQPRSPLLQHQEVQCECKTADGVFVELVVSAGLCTAAHFFTVGKWIGRHAGLPLQAGRRQQQSLPAPTLLCI